ncbi:MAG: hypothetical protein AABX60_00570 [Nanoarchaeota archaeon]
MEEHYPSRYFKGVQNQRSQSHPSQSLDGIVAFCYKIIREVSDFAAAAAVNNGINSVRDYVPLMRQALVGLNNFQLAIFDARSYGAYFWPNTEMRGFANSLIELGINMKHHYEDVAQGNDAGRMSPESIRESIREVGVAVQQSGVAFAKFATGAPIYFYSEKLRNVVAANQPSLKLSETIVDGLVVEALSADFGSCAQHK